MSPPAPSHACNSVYSAGTSISLPSTMSLVIASSLSQLAVGWCDAGSLHGRLHPLLGVGAVGRKIGRLNCVFLAQERQVRLQVVGEGCRPLSPAGKGGGGFLAGIEEIGDEALILDPLVAIAGLDRVIVRRREFRICEREVRIAQKCLPRTCRPIVGTDFVDLKQNRNKAEQRNGRLRHLRQRPVFVPPQQARLRHQDHSAATICAGSRMPASSMSALRVYSSIRSSIS